MKYLFGCVLVGLLPFSVYAAEAAGAAEKVTVVEADVKSTPTIESERKPTPSKSVCVDSPIEMKFDDAHAMRLRDGLPRLTGGKSLDKQTREFLSRQKRQGWYRLMSSVDEAFLETIRKRAEANSGKAAPDLNNFFMVCLSSGKASDFIAQLRKLPAVAYAGVMPTDQPEPVVPDFTDPNNFSGFYQSYLYGALEQEGVGGVSALYAHGQNLFGSGVQVVDIESDYNPDHVDINNDKVTLVGNPPAFDENSRSSNHGTSTLGVIGAYDNQIDGLGITGIAPDATLKFRTKYLNGVEIGVTVLSIPDAISSAAESVNIGDIILLEMQIAGPNRDQDAEVGDHRGLVPVEWNYPTYQVVKTIVNAGYVVVEAAGNGYEDLDSSDYHSTPWPFLRAHDSGAILVGAGSTHHLEPTRLAFSNYGSRVDIQAWGRDIVAPGNANYDGRPVPVDNIHEEEGVDRDYRSYGGTSGASAMVAGVVALLQQEFKNLFGRPATSKELRFIMAVTGTPQHSEDGTNIGPRPDLERAIRLLRGDQSALSKPTFCEQCGGALPKLSVEPNGALVNQSQTFQISTGYNHGLIQSGILYTLDDSEPDGNGQGLPDNSFLQVDGGEILRARSTVNVPISLQPLLGSKLVSEVATPYNPPYSGSDSLYIYPADLALYDLYSNPSFYILYTDDGSEPDQPDGLGSAQGGNGIKLHNQNGWLYGSYESLDSSRQIKYARYITDLEYFYVFLCAGNWGYIEFCDLEPLNTGTLEANYTFVEPGLPWVHFNLAPGYYPATQALGMSIPGETDWEIWYTTEPIEQLAPEEPYRGGPNSRRVRPGESVYLPAGYEGNILARGYLDPDSDGVYSAGPLTQRFFSIGN